MQKFITLLFIGFFLFSCKTTKETAKNTKNRKPIVLKTKNNTSKTAEKGKTITAKGSAKEVLNEAKTYLGTKYLYGGTSKAGIDCSGLVFNSFKTVDVKMERRSQDQAKQGIEIKLNEVQPGDILFFNTSGTGISHAGIVESIQNREVFFIHSSTSKGVIVSSIEDKYWKPKFVIAKRILK